MYYSIGEVANAAGIAISTLHYYDREGMFPDMARSNGGIRVFSDTEINTLKVILAAAIPRRLCLRSIIRPNACWSRS